MQLTFDTLDCSIFIGLLMIFLGIGLYFRLISKAPKTIENYLIGSRNMAVIPIAMSLIASKISVVSIRTIPVEIYHYGLHIIWSDLSLLIALPIIFIIILPIFKKNGIWNCFEYLEERFDRKTRTLATVAFIFQAFLMLPVVMYIPSLLFSQLTDINVHVINGIVCCVCIIYTMLGGLKAVVWTQMFQGLFIFSAVITISVFILMKNNFYDLLKTANDGGRLYATNFTLDLYTRSTFWNTLIGGTFSWISFVGVQPIFVQRMMSIKSTKNTKKSLIIFTIGYLLFSLIIYFIGIAMYSRFYDCDPQQAGITNDLVTYFIHDFSGNSKIIPSLYIACLFCAALSTMSSNLNIIAGILYCHFSTQIHSMDLDNIDYNKRANRFMKTIIIVFGIYSIVGALLIEQFDWVIQLIVIASGVFQYFFAGLFLFGFLYPKAIGDAAFRAAYIGIGISALMHYGNLLQKAIGFIQDVTLPISVENCDAYNITVINENLNVTLREEAPDQVAGPVFKISLFWYSFIIFVLIWMLGIPFTKLMGYNKTQKKLNLKLISSTVIKYIPEKELFSDKPSDCESESLNVQKV